MRFLFYSTRSFERWDFRSSVEKGIGGSETSHVELCWRLARRGHECISYVDLPEDQVSGVEWRGTKWYDKKDADFSLPGIWVLYRCPEMVDVFDRSRTDQVLWLVCQDYDYADLWTPSRVAGLDRIVPMCNFHRDMLLKAHPEFRDKLWVTRNAIKLDLIEEVEAAGIPERDPHRMMYASSPDRGLLSSLKVFRRAKEFVPDLKLVASYGYDNLDKLIAKGMAPDAPPVYRASAARFQRDKDECMKLVEETGAVFLGRISQHQLYREWLKTSMLIYISTFAETGWITGLEAQALGAIPIFTPVAAQGENTKHGIGIYGDPNDPATICHAAAEVVRLAKNPELQEEIRSKMMPDVRANWDWEQFVWKKDGENLEQAAEADLAAAASRTTVDLKQDPQLPQGICDNHDEIESRARWLHLKQGDVMFDVGAADGSWTISAAKQGAFVYAFDLKAEFMRLDEMVEKSEVETNVFVVEAFVFNQTGGVRKVSRGTEERKVPVLTLDTFVMAEGVDHVDFIKVDVEGAEIEVLQGATGLLTKHKPRLMIEVHCETVPGFNVDLKAVTKFLDSLDVGYQYEPVKLSGHKGRRYYHLYAWVPQKEDEEA